MRPEITRQSSFLVLPSLFLIYQVVFCWPNKRTQTDYSLSAIFTHLYESKKRHNSPYPSSQKLDESQKEKGKRKQITDVKACYPVHQPGLLNSHTALLLYNYTQLEHRAKRTNINRINKFRSLDQSLIH